MVSSYYSTNLGDLYSVPYQLLLPVIQDQYIDLTITSPPYGDLREYNGYDFDFKFLADELFRVTKIGGVVVWVVRDQSINGSETGDSFRQALYFKEIGFNIHDTMIRTANGCQFSNPRHKRYFQVFDYMFIFSKGIPKTFNPIVDRKTIYGGRTKKYFTERQKNGFLKKKDKKHIYPEYSKRYNVWHVPNAGIGNKLRDKVTHPAIFPESLANDHIISWSNAGDMVLDPMAGSGTTLVAAELSDRRWIGCDVSSEYCAMAMVRISNEYI